MTVHIKLNSQSLFQDQKASSQSAAKSFLLTVVFVGIFKAYFKGLDLDFNF